MELLQDPPPGFDGVSNAYAMARHLPSTHKLNLQVGLARAGVLIATGRLDGYRQVSFFSEHLRDLGWREELLGSDGEMHGCDLLFSLPPERDAGRDEDPSFIRRTPVLLWGDGTSHEDAARPGAA
jgi:hypothetical protein